VSVYGIIMSPLQHSPLSAIQDSKFPEIMVSDRLPIGLGIKHHHHYPAKPEQSRVDNVEWEI
jgi:hypothetical protein